MGVKHMEKFVFKKIHLKECNKTFANIVFSQKQLKSVTHPIREISEAYSKNTKF